MKPYDHEGVAWFTHVYPRLIKPSEEYGGKSAAEYYGMVEMLQHPKETVFVPGGWAHVVMNLGECVNSIIIYLYELTIKLIIIIILLNRFNHCYYTKLLLLHQY
jgi:hypothetical protein